MENSLDTASPYSPEALLSLEMVRIEGGTFEMGSEDKDAYKREKPVHSVSLNSFYLAKYPVTQALWEELEEENRSRFGGMRRPVDRVSWYEAVAFCNKLSVAEGREPFYIIKDKIKDPNNLHNRDEQKWTVIPIPGADGFRLPTEAEWEYAARAGRNNEYRYAGTERLKQAGWYDENSRSQTRECGLLLPNQLGLYDLSGNVYEWCWDWHGDYPKNKELITNPTGPKQGSDRVLRGGDWYLNARYCRVSYRTYYWPYEHDNNIGFRLACSAQFSE